MMEFLQNRDKDEVCQICGKNFTDRDTVQSTSVECSNCHSKKIICEPCRKRGCKCGGDFLNTFDINPEIFH